MKTTTSTETLNHIINGKDFAGTGDKTLKIYNPAKGKVIRTIQSANKNDVNQAVAAAKKALVGWRKTTPSQRAHLMHNFRHLLYERKDALAKLISEEHGKTLDDAKGELMRGIEVVEFCTSINVHLKSDFHAEVSNDIDCYNMRFPMGVCAGITPFNFPAMVPMWMFPVAIACGNTFVLKLSERDPSCCLAITKLMEEAGFPPGVLNTVVGDKEAVDTLLVHDDVASISFVGSTPVGEYIYKEGCKHNKRVQALCGAKNHMVVMPDANIEQVCDAALGAAYGSAGERCMAISVLVAVSDATADEIIAKLKPKVAALKVGAFTETDSEMGPVITNESKERILKYIEKGIEKGASLVVDGRQNDKDEGFFVGGCLFDNVDKTMEIYSDEIFGPVLCVVRAQSYNEAIDLVNSHEYGNGAAIFTRDGDTARHFTMHAEAGMVGVNIPIPVPVAMQSFGGWKRSLFGGSAIHGMEGIRFYTKLKTITSRWPSGIRQGAQFNFHAGKDNK